MDANQMCETCGDPITFGQTVFRANGEVHHQSCKYPESE